MEQTNIKQEETSKCYLIDSSVILEDVNHLKILSQDNTNYLFVNDTILEEIDRKKDSFNETEAKFQARNFSRLANNELDKKLEKKDLPESIQKIIEEKNYGDNFHKIVLDFNGGSKIKIDVIVINRDKYRTPIESVQNDKHILEILKDYKLELIVNDMLFKTIAKANGGIASSLKAGEVSEVAQIDFLHKVSEKDLDSLDLENMSNYEQIVINKVIEAEGTNKDLGEIETREQKFAIVKNNKLEYLDFSESGKKKKYTGVFIKPINREQDFLYHCLTNSNNKISVVSGATGSGKTLITFQSALTMLYDKTNMIDGIVYTRNTVDAVDKEARNGFRKGGEEEKVGVYMYPLNNAINLVIENKNKKNQEREDKPLSFKKDEETSKFMSDNNIETMDISLMRGITFENKFIIIDETQNMSDATLKLIATRVGKNSVIVFLGDIKQNDHSYLSKTRNALATLLKMAKGHNEVSGFVLTKTIRSETAEFFDKYLP